MLIKFHLFKNKLPLYNKAMDTYALRQRVIAENIANANTPEYNPKRVKFEELFSQSGNNPQISGVEGGGYKFNGLSRNDNEVEPQVEDQEIPEPEEFFTGDNHINIDKEMAELAKNQIRFRMASRMTNRFFTGLSAAIKGHGQ